MSRGDEAGARLAPRAVVRAVLARCAEDSIAIRWGLGLVRGSIVLAVSAAVVRPSLAYLGGPVAPESEEQAQRAIDRLADVARGSTSIQTVTSGIRMASRAWSMSATGRLWESWAGQFLLLALWERMRVMGWVVLLATLAAGVIKWYAEGPWPWLSVTLWAAIVAGSAILAAAPAEFAAAWEDFRTPGVGGRRTR